MQIPVLCAERPAAVERVAGSRGVLEDVSGDPHAGPIADGHAKRGVRALEVKPIPRARGTVSSVVPVSVEAMSFLSASPLATSTARLTS